MRTGIWGLMPIALHCTVNRMRDLGWSDAVAQAFEGERARDLMPSRVSLEHSDVCRVLAADRQWPAEAASQVKYLAAGRHDVGYASFLKRSPEREADPKRRSERAPLDTKRRAKTNEHSVWALRKGRGH